MASPPISTSLSPTEEAILWQIRVPRVMLAALVGAMLSLAGATYQGVFRNPLADPYLLGVAAGAGLGATIAIAYLPDGLRGQRVLPVAARPGWDRISAVRTGSIVRIHDSIASRWGPRLVNFFRAMSAALDRLRS